jgi:hypothetical protein
LDVKPYTITKFSPGPGGQAPYYQMFTMPFESAEAMNTALASEGMQEFARDAYRMSAYHNGSQRRLVPLILAGDLASSLNNKPYFKRGVSM